MSALSFPLFQPTRLSPPPKNRPRTPLRLGFLTPHNPFDRRAFSGTCFHAANALQAQPDLTLSILGHKRHPGRLARYFKHPSQPDVSRLDLSNIDLVVGMVATPLLKDLIASHPTVPFIHVTDATPAYLREVYGWKTPPDADEDEAWVARNAVTNVYSSDVMARRAHTDLNLPGIVTDTLSFGLNSVEKPDICPEKPSLEQVKLLFVGTDWMRKGGDVAVAATKQLLAAGHNVSLTVVGQTPDGFQGQNIHATGYLDKNKRRDRKKLARLFAESHLLLLPSRADCTPMVIAEAMAQGTPVIASDVGGISSMIAGAGRPLPAFSPPEDWAAAIVDMTRDRMAYDILSDASFDKSIQNFSWTLWAERIAHLGREAVETRLHRDLKASVCT